MSAIEDFGKIKRSVSESKRWANMLGKQYRGGGGGVGCLRSIKLSCELYYQEYDSAKNYHESDPALNDYIARIVSHTFPAILKSAIDAMERDLMIAAGKAQKEHAELMAAAGIEVLP